MQTSTVKVTMPRLLLEKFKRCYVEVPKVFLIVFHVIRNQARLQRNLMYLAAIADSQPQPPTMHAQVEPPFRNRNIKFL